VSPGDFYLPVTSITNVTPFAKARDTSASAQLCHTNNNSFPFCCCTVQFKTAFRVAAGYADAVFQFLESGTAMIASKSILIISRDEPLQRRRSIILERARYAVSAALNDQDALGFGTATNSFNLVRLSLLV